MRVEQGMVLFVPLTVFVATAVLAVGCGGEEDAPEAVAAAPSPAVLQQLFWIDRAGNVGSAIGEPQALITNPALSPDGSRIVVRAQDREGDRDDIWVHRVDVPRKTRVTEDPADDKMPTWSPTGDRVAFYSYRNGLADLYVRMADGSGQDEGLVTTEETHEYGPSWSPDGKTVVYHVHDPETDRRELKYVTVGDGEVRPFLPGAASIAMPEFSPDGRYVAYVSDESGRFEVYVRAFPDGQESWKISTDGGMWPKWSGGSGELFFFDGTDVATVAVQRDPFRVSAPRKLFAASQVGMESTIWNAFNPLFDVADDGQRFVVVRNTVPE